MSLNVDESGRRGRSRSPGGRRRIPDNEDRDRERDRSRGPPMPPAANVISAGVPYHSDDGMGGPQSPAYEYERLASWRPPSPGGGADGTTYGMPGGYRGSREKVDEDVRVTYGGGGGRREKDYRYEKERTSDRERDSDRERRDRDRDADRKRDKSPAPGLDQFKYLPQKYAQKITVGPQDRDDPKRSRDSVYERDSDRERRGKDRDSDRDRDRGKDRSKRDYDDDLAYGKEPGPSKKDRDSAKYTYGEVKPWEYEKTSSESVRYTREDARYSSTSVDPRPGGANRAPSPGPQRSESKKYNRDSYLGADDPRRSSSSVVTVEPGQGPRRSAMKGGRERDASPQPPTARMSSLSVNTGHHSASVSLLSGAPASPLLESYHGTYQSMSPMPSPLLLPTGHGSSHDIIPVSPIGSDNEGYGADGKKKSRRARFHDPVDDASRLAKALKGERRAPDTEPLIEILPGLTHEQVMELRVEYKRLVKTGSERKGVNIAKHIRARLKDEDPNLMKACYAVALGRWESEAYWANFWYQGDKTRRELLIESLMGRTNDEIRAIKEGFSDKKYGNSLTKCMKTELKEDKFKKAVLMVLDEQRMEETDAYGRPNRIDYDLVKDDVKELYRSVRSEKGGESLMISIVVQRSDTHLREVMQVYTDTYRANFAKDALKKSGNLVGELLAHILNGVINKPVRDALLIHHALSASKKDQQRRELIISRLVRYHWDSRHMAAVKVAFRERYGAELQQAVKEATSGEWGEFCTALCVSRMPDHVKRIERVDGGR
ncbi:hypothetical protein GE09DRAFT_570576 [Coniochaeta sp. 2T2.1]|nr:hypothetical protein GE09DRAFT_570576 [Coniochaeta sp. 2T2.1]